MRQLDWMARLRDHHRFTPMSPRIKRLKPPCFSCTFPGVPAPYSPCFALGKHEEAFSARRSVGSREECCKLLKKDLESKSGKSSADREGEDKKAECTETKF
uniref:Uncharacterized protein n=1 Tax=Trichuris muris TaxID=70415 RepID=A0A5S6QIE0_TRIMR